MANAALSPSRGRQSPLFAQAVIDYTQMIDTAVAVPIVKLPIGAIVVGGFMVVDVASNGGTSVAVAIGDATLGTRYASAVDAKATAGTKTALTVTGYVSPAGEDIVITPTYGGTAPTAGSIRVLVEYIIDGRATEVQPN